MQHVLAYQCVSRRTSKELRFLTVMGDGAATWGGFGRANVTAAGPDIIGNHLVRIL